MQVGLIILSSTLALVNALCYYDRQKWNCGNWVTKPLDDVPAVRKWSPTKPLGDGPDRNWRPYRRYYLDDVIYYVPYDSKESASSESRPKYSTSRCFTSVQRPAESDKSHGRKITHYVYLVHEAKTYQDAREYCEEKNGNLVKIDGSNDKIKIRRLIEGKCGRDGDYWIGLNKLDEDGRGGKGYYWDLDHSYPDKKYWWSHANKHYDCVAMVQEGNYEWSARRCSQKMAFICEYDHRL